jgi:hypothetical protein
VRVNRPTYDRQQNCANLNHGILLLALRGVEAPRLTERSPRVPEGSQPWAIGGLGIIS